MVYFYYVIFLAHSFMLYCAERESLPLITYSGSGTNSHTFNNPQTTITINNSSTPLEQINANIKKFLRQQVGEEFEMENRVFNTHSVLRWHGFTNKVILSHAQEKLHQLEVSAQATRTDRPITNSPATLYAQMLQDLIECSETNDKKQKEALCKKAVITGLGTVLLAAVQYFTNYIPSIN